MRRLRAGLIRLAGWFGGSRREGEWNHEFQSHLQLHIEDNLRSGMSEKDARKDALAKFGSITSARESMRDRATFAWMENIWQDSRYALRSLRRSPGFAATAILSLTLGIGASLAVFTVTDNFLLRPLPYLQAAQLVTLWESNTQLKFEHASVSPGNYYDWKAQTDIYSGIAGLRERRSVLIDGNRAEEFGKQIVSADFFPLLGVQPVRGRLFTAEEDLAAAHSDTLVLISYRLWQRWFDGNDNVIGRKVQVNSVPRTIIGVLPRDFYFLNREVDLWEPLGLNPAQDYRNTEGRYLTCVARMQPGVTHSQAQARMTALAKRLQAAYPVFNKNWTAEVEPLRDSMYRDVKTPLLVLLGAVGLMLAVACANLANLLLARYSSRRREIAVRVSLGAGRWRVIRQLLTESIVLSLAGGVCGLLLARWAIAGLLAFAPGSLAQSSEVHIDPRVFAFAAILSLVTGIFFGIAPALVSSRPDLTGALRGDSRSGLGAGGRLRGWLVGAEVTISVVLLVGALLLFRSLVGLQTLHPGLDPSDLLTFRVSIPAARYQKVAQRTQFFERAIQQIEQLPGVKSVSAVIHPPFSGDGFATLINVEGRAKAKTGEEPLVVVRSVMPGYFRTLGIPLKEGRDFTAADNRETGPQRFIVNQAFAQLYFQGERPLGRKINVLMEEKNPFGEIVGVVGDIRELSIEREPMPTVYYVYSQLAFTALTFVVRAANNPLSVGEPARRIIQGLDPTQPIAEVRTMEEILGENYARQRFSAWLLSGFSLAALLLAAIGIYGVLAYSVTARTREIGVRVALGADSVQVVALVLKTGARPVIAGAIAGIAGALAVTGLMKSLLFGIAPRDPLTFAVVPGLLTIVALLAAYLPARRAARLDPMEALRTD